MAAGVVMESPKQTLTCAEAAGWGALSRDSGAGRQKENWDCGGSHRMGAMEDHQRAGPMGQWAGPLHPMHTAWGSQDQVTLGEAVLWLRCLGRAWLEACSIMGVPCAPTVASTGGNSQVLDRPGGRSLSSNSHRVLNCLAENSRSDQGGTFPLCFQIKTQ